MDMKKIIILSATGKRLGIVSANIEPGYLYIEGRQVWIREVNHPSHRFEACFVKGNNSKLYPQ